MLRVHAAKTSRTLLRPGTAARLIINHVRGSAEHTLLDPDARDHITEPYIKLQQRCVASGYRFEGARDQLLDECRWVVFWDTWRVGSGSLPTRLVEAAKARACGESSRDLFQEVLRAGMEHKLVLFMYEPPCVFPRNYDRGLHAHFPVVFTWDPTLADGKRYHRIYIPNPTTFPVVTPAPFPERKLFVDISGYKFSRHPRELYTERRRLVRFFESNYPDAFDLYGEGWNPRLRAYLWRRIRDPKVLREFYPSYRGTVRHKWEIYPHYRFGVCYENMIDQPGYVSIKIFDCMRARCVPIYLGAPDITDYVDSEAFVDRRQFTSDAEMAKYLAGLGEREYQRYLDAGERYLCSDRFKPFLAEHFVDTVTKVLRLGDSRGDGGS
ncbi:MAG TPA: glycosyltransferase family 10 [bacterium]|nr:glycosyltransferase family 10 [bacterium]